MDTTQFELFKDCLASRLFNEPGFQNDTDELSDFASYLASEAWPVVPQAYQAATYEERGALGLGSDAEIEQTLESLSLDALSPSFVDTLISYGQAEDTDDAEKFVKKVLESYLEQAVAPPPVWSSTRTSECEICEREVPLTYHHLIPRSTHDKVLKKGWHPESMINKVAWLCR